MLRGSKLKTALSKIRLTAVHGPWFRLVAFRHLRSAPQPLWAGASKSRGARFTPKDGFDSLYLASEPVTALLEVQALVLLPGGPVALKTEPWVLVTVEGIVSNVLDLTNAPTLKALGTNEQEMTGAWVTNPKPPTQELARVAYDSGRISGILYGSAKNPGGRNFVIFPGRLSAGSSDFLEVFDPYENLSHRIGNPAKG